MDGTRVLGVAPLVSRVALHPHGRPAFERLLQPGVAVGDDQEWRWQPARLQIGQQPAPRGRGFRRRELQRHELFLPGVTAVNSLCIGASTLQ